ncbi:hypothetical protein RIF29_38667 [Crotalaria pallida]|uniref:Uncharacterized protein n=1 Tax=Crotalaria pallida TaxID=3830 RepID=A0AAN9DZT4_CROPI
MIKQLIRRLSRIAHSSHDNYTLLHPESPRRSHYRRSDKIRRSSSVVPEGHVPIYVGDEMERFVVSFELLNHPIFVNLLNQSAQEYGYEGVLRLPCHVIVFKRVLDALRRGRDTREIQELINFSSSEEVCYR